MKPNNDLAYCAECGMHTGSAAVFHPWLFCLLVKAGISDPEPYLADLGYVRSVVAVRAGGADK